MPRFPGYFFLRNLVRQHGLLAQMVKRDFRQRFVGSVGGWLWGVIHPLVLLACWVFVFQVCLKAELPADAITRNYPLFLFTGFLPWLLFQETLTRSATSLLEQANLITKTVFPSEIVPVSLFLSALVSHALSLAMVVAAIALWQGHFGPLILLLPLYMLLAGLFAVGLAWIFSSLQVYLRDTAQVLTVILTVWFWVTPIFIAPQDYPRPARILLDLNPMAYLVKAYRQCLLSSQPPLVSDLAILTAFSLSTFLAGGLAFRHLKRGFADVL